MHPRFSLRIERLNPSQIPKYPPPSSIRVVHVFFWNSVVLGPMYGVWAFRHGPLLLVRSLLFQPPSNLKALAVSFKMEQPAG